MKENKRNWISVEDLEAGMKKVYIRNCEIVEGGEVEVYDIRGDKVKVCNAKISDGSGEVNLTAWGHASKFLNMAKEQDKKFTVWNCYCKEVKGGEHEGELQLTTGRYGKIKLQDRD